MRQSNLIIVFILVLLLSNLALAQDYAFIMGQKEVIFVQYETGSKNEMNPDLRAYQARQEATKKVYLQYLNWLNSLTFQKESLGDLMENDPMLKHEVQATFFLNSRLEEIQYPDGMVKNSLIVSWNRTPLALVLDRLYRQRAYIMDKDANLRMTKWHEDKGLFDQSRDSSLAQKSDVSIYQGYTGIIIDTRGFHVKPSMAPKIFDQNGAEVYGTMDADPDYVIEVGIVGYTYSIDEAIEADRIGDNPLVIKAVGRSGNARDHAIIQMEQAEFLYKLRQNSSIFTECKVLFVIDE